MNRENTRGKGNLIEKKVSEYLSNKGYIILENNYHCKFGEIDIIAKHRDTLVFIEVKYRKNNYCGYPSEAVNIHKQYKIIKTSLFYIKEKNLSLNLNYRYDVVEVLGKNINIIENAFNYLP